MQHVAAVLFGEGSWLTLLSFLSFGYVELSMPVWLGTDARPRKMMAHCRVHGLPRGPPLFHHFSAQFTPALYCTDARIYIWKALVILQTMCDMRCNLCLGAEGTTCSFLQSLWKTARLITGILLVTTDAVVESD